MNAVLTNRFTPAPGQQFQILACGSCSGLFSATNIPTGLSLTYSNTGALLLVSSPVSPTLVNPAKTGTNFTFSFQTEIGVRESFLMTLSHVNQAALVRCDLELLA